MMFCHEMRLHLVEFLTVQMDQLSAFLAFAMKAVLRIFMAVRFHILETGGTVPVNAVLFDDSLVDQAFQIPVDR